MAFATVLRPFRNSLQKKIYDLMTGLLGDENGLVKLPVLSGPARGLFFKLRLTSYSEGSILAGTYERAVAERILQQIRPGMVIWDCGTFVGYYTLLLARATGPQGKVVAFEPDRANFKRTQDNMLMNGFKNVRMIDAAIGGPVGEVSFISTQDQTSHLANTYVGGSQATAPIQPGKPTVIQVKCYSLNQLVQRSDIPRPDFIKLDLEGAEAEALNHIDDLIAQCRPILAIELHNPQCDEALWAFAQRHQYSVSSLEKGNVIAERTQVGGIVLATPRSR